MVSSAVNSTLVVSVADEDLYNATSVRVVVSSNKVTQTLEPDPCSPSPNAQTLHTKPYIPNTEPYKLLEVDEPV